MPTRPPTHKPARLPAARRPGRTRAYGRSWDKIRAAVLAQQPLCVACEQQGRLTAASEVDHVISLARGGSHERANLQSLCKSCHSRKTAKLDGGFGRGSGHSISPS
jgi:5-methylcytosine-specific restriction protein A